MSVSENRVDKDSKSPVELLFSWNADGALAAELLDPQAGTRTAYPETFIKPSGESDEEFCARVASMIEHELERPVKHYMPAETSQPKANRERAEEGADAASSSKKKPLWLGVAAIVVAALIAIYFVVGPGSKGGSSSSHPNGLAEEKAEASARDEKYKADIEEAHRQIDSGHNYVAAKILAEYAADGEHPEALELFKTLDLVDVLDIVSISAMSDETFKEFMEFNETYLSVDSGPSISNDGSLYQIIGYETNCGVDLDSILLSRSDGGHIIISLPSWTSADDAQSLCNELAAKNNLSGTGSLTGVGPAAITEMWNTDGTDPEGASWSILCSKNADDTVMMSLSRNS